MNESGSLLDTMITSTDRHYAAAIAAAIERTQQHNFAAVRDRQRFVLSAREREQPATLEELAEALRIDQSRVSRIEADARRARDRGEL